MRFLVRKISPFVQVSVIRNVDVDINKIRDKIERDNKEHLDSMEYIKVRLPNLRYLVEASLFQTQKIHDLNEHIGKALAQMEELGNQGKVRERVEHRGRA